MQMLAFVNEVVGRASLVRGDGAVEPLRHGDLLREGDFLLATDARIRIVFADGSSLTIVDGGQLLLKQVTYDAASNIDAVTVAAAGGNFQFVPGALGNQPMAAMLVETPAAIIHPGRSAFAFQHTSADGLGLSLIDASPSDAPPLVVDNDVGSAAIVDDRQRITVSGPDSAPMLVPDFPAAEADSVAVEVSAGGDEGAFPGDPIVVTGAPELFDLAPEAAPLPGPYSGTWLQASSISLAPEHHRDDLLFGGQGTSLSAGEGTSPGSGSPSEGGSKYRTLTGWEPLNLVWELNGSGQVTGEAPTFPYGRDSLQIQPTEKNSMAGLALVSEQVPSVVLEEFFGLGGGSLARLSNGAVEGSAIRAPLALSAGAELSFDFFFDAGDTLPRNDFALAMVGGDTFKLSDIAAIADENSTRNIDASGWRTVVYKVSASGTYTIGFASVDDRIAADPSALYIDNVRIDRQFGGGWVVVAQQGPWRTLVQGAVAQDDVLTVGEDEVLSVSEASLLANDTDPDPFDRMTITGIDRTGTVGRATLGSGGIVSYRATGFFNHLAQDETANDSFRYLVDPGNGVTSTATVRVTIIGVNDAPVATADSTVVAADTAVPVDVLRNDDDIDSDDDRASLRVVGAQAAYGQASFSGQPGTGLAYVPGRHFVSLGVGETATDTITYVIQDRHGARATATVDVGVKGVNDAPTALADAVSTNEDAATVIAVLANDTDPDIHDDLTIISVDTTLTRGQVLLSADRSISYDPRGQFDNLALGETAPDSFRYRIDDGHGGSSDAETRVTIIGANDAPVARADATSVSEDGSEDNNPYNIDVLANDDDIDSDDDRSSLRLVAAQSAAGAEVRFSGQAGAGLSYAPAGRFEHLAVGETAIDTITYTVEDRHGARATSTVGVNVQGANDAPTANDDNGSIDEDSTLALPLLANDTDPDRSDRLQVTSINGESIAPGGRVTLVSGAIVTMNAAGALEYDPRGHFDFLPRDERATDSFYYSIEDGHGGSSEAKATITIVGRNDPPTAVADAATVGEDDPAIFIDVLANDFDIDAEEQANELFVLAAESKSGVPVAFFGSFGDSITYHSGTWQFNELYAELDEGERVTDTITYRVADQRGGESTGTVTVTIVGANDAPRAVDDFLMIDANTMLHLPRVGGLLENDFDPDRAEDHNKEWIRIVAVDGQSANVGATITLASGALLSVNADGGLRYDPNGQFDGLTDFERAIDGFSYTVVDDRGATATATATISIQGKNDPPTANADRFFTDEDSAVRFSVLDNDEDPDAGGNLRILSIDTAQTRGSVRVNNDGTLTYDPGAGFGGLGQGETATDTFTYVVDDFVGGRGTGLVTVTVGGVVDPRTSSQELIQSFEVGPLPNPTWEFFGTVATSARIAVVSQAGQVAFQPTHFATLLLLEASGWDAPAIERALSNDITVGGRPLVHLPNDPQDGSSPYTGAALKTTLSLASSDLAGGRITLSFDWNFISGEAQPALTSNDYAVFTVTDGVTAQVYKLADARQTSSISDGWRMSVYDVSAQFALPARGDLKLTLGFAVLNDQSPDNPSRLLVDNVRLNRLADDHQELIRTDGSLTIYRERPEATDDTISVVGDVAIDEDQAVSFGADQLLANDAVSKGVDGATMRVVGLDTQGMTGAASLSGASVFYDPRGRFDFLAEGQTGTDILRYLVGDANGGTGEAAVTITVTGHNDAPSSETDSVEVEEGVASVALDVLANDDDIDSDDDRGTLRIVAASAAATGALVAFSGVAGAGLVYRPSSSGAFAGLGEGETAIDTISYTIEDSHGARAAGSALVTVVGRNDTPTASSDGGVTDEDTAISIAVVANDTDPDIRDRLFIGAINGTAITTPGAHVALPSGAIASVGVDGALRYDPASGFSRLARGETARDTFTYTASDGHGGASTANISVMVSGRNDAPVAGDDVLSTNASTRLTVAASTLLSNDIEVDAGDGIALIGIDATSTLGTVSFDGATVSYDPTSRFRGLGEGETATDSFTYRISDRDGATDSGSVTVHVRGVNDAPVAADDSALTDEDRPIIINVRANDADPDTHDGLPTVSSIDTSGTRGLVTINADGSITYDPRGRFDSLNTGQVDHDFFTYRIADGHGAFDEGSVSVEIAGRSDTERLIDSFEAPFTAANRSSSVVTTVGQYQETAGAPPYLPTDGRSMAKLEAFGTSAQKIGSQTVSALESFLGLPDRSLPRDPGDNSLPANGSAFKLKMNVQAGDEISFDWMFDARDTVSTPPADNDYAVLTVVGGAGGELFKLSDVRQTGDHGASGWRSSIYTASTTGELTIGFGAVNDRVADALGQGSVLLVDNVRFNRDFDHGYQIVDHQADGRFETVVAVG